MARPLVRNAANTDWIDVFCKGGWKMKTLEGDYITLNAFNTKFRNADNTGWVEFSCPIPVPVAITGGSVRSGRFLDSNGYLWATHTPVGVFEDESIRFPRFWQKVKTSTNGPYLNGIESLYSDEASSVTLFMRDGRVLFSGLNNEGQRGDGTAAPSPTGIDSAIHDVTAAWKKSIGEFSQIAMFSGEGFLIRTDGIPFVLGVSGTETTPTSSSPSSNLVETAGLNGTTPNQVVSTSTTYRIKDSVVSIWTQPNYTPDGTSTAKLQRIKSMAMSMRKHLFALTVDGELLQPSLWMRNTAYNRYPSGFPKPTEAINALRPMRVPFTQGVPKVLHTGGLLETENGDLFYPSGKDDFPTDVGTTHRWFYKFDWYKTGINTKMFGSKVVRIVAHLGDTGNMFVSNYTVNPSIFILLEDGRLYVAGDNTRLWFGIGKVASVPLANPVLSNNNIVDFDVYGGNGYAVKKDGTLLACGTGSTPGIGDAPADTSVWQTCIFKSLT